MLKFLKLFSHKSSFSSVLLEEVELEVAKFNADIVRKTLTIKESGTLILTTYMWKYGRVWEKLQKSF